MKNTIEFDERSWFDTGSTMHAHIPGEQSVLIPEDLLSAVEENVRRRSSECAIRHVDGVEITYGALWERSGWLAATLAADRIGSGDRVAVALDRSPEFVVAVLGIARAGAACVPLDPQAPAARHELILREAQVRAVVVGDREWTVSAGVPPVGLPRTDPGLPVPVVRPAPDDPLYIGYTSGSTGVPKGAVIPHGAVSAFTDRPGYCVVRPGDRVANVANPAFDATTFEVWNTLVAGATIAVLPPVLDLPAHEWGRTLREHRVSAMFLTSALFHAVAREDPAAFASLDTLLVGGELADVRVVSAVCADRPPRRLMHVYGPTETTTFATAFECTTGTLADRARVPIGQPIQQTVAYVLGADLHPVPDGERGELCLGGPQLATGYFGRADLTAERFVTVAGGERVYRTGDLVRRLPGGELDFLGRTDRQVKLRGFRVELDEVELAVLGTGLAAAVRVEKVISTAIEQLAAVIVPVGGADGEALSAALAERLPAYMVPTRWVTVPGMPLTANGKIDSDALATLLVADDPGPADVGQPQSATAARVREVIVELLGLTAVRPEDNFLEIGGNSIVALQATARLRSRLGVTVNPADLLFSDTVADLEQHIDELVRQSR
jgi:amino acid adenylation domain-containing protein